jgi:hypothetical protein
MGSLHYNQPVDTLITGFQLYSDGTLYIMRGFGTPLPCQPDHLFEDDYKALLWAIEAALNAKFNAFAQTDPGSIRCLLQAVALACCLERPAPVFSVVLQWSRQQALLCHA